MTSPRHLKAVPTETIPTHLVAPSEWPEATKQIFLGEDAVSRAAILLVVNELNPHLRHNTTFSGKLAEMRQVLALAQAACDHSTRHADLLEAAQSNDIVASLRAATRLVWRVDTRVGF